MLTKIANSDDFEDKNEIDKYTYVKKIIDYNFKDGTYQFYKIYLLLYLLTYLLPLLLSI